jgi:hypothetical protein
MLRGLFPTGLVEHPRGGHVAAPHIGRRSKQAGIPVFIVPHTGRFAMALGYHVTLVKDATAAPSGDSWTVSG